MPQAIYVNLCVASLQRSIDFFERLGFSFNPKFTNEQAAALVISETIWELFWMNESDMPPS